MHDLDIPAKEDSITEFKTSFNIAVIETLVAFANTKGGSVYIGIHDNGKITGVQLNPESVQNWVNEIKCKTEPTLIPDVDIIEVDKKQIVKLHVKEYPVKPLSVQGRYYKRHINSNHLMNASEVSDCYLQSMQYSWDSYPHSGGTLDSLDNKRIEHFFNRISEKGRIQLNGSTRENLVKLKLIKEGIPTNAAMLLFAKDPLMYDIHVGRLKTSSLILDDRIIRNTLFEAVDETMRYIIGHLKVAYEITGGTTQRTEIFEYPLTALRELVLNAIIHREYTSPIDIQIKIFDNKITIFNPGKLYGNLTVQDLHRDDYQASARNKLVVEAFYLTGDIEKYGTGYSRVRQVIKEYPTMTFEYQEVANGFLVELNYKIQKNSTVTENVTENVTEKRQRQILSIIKSIPQITTTQLALLQHVTSRTILRDLDALKSQGKLRRVGGDKGGYWEINE